MTGIILRAFLFAARIHDGQTRKDGKPYIGHPFSVAMELARNGADENLIAAGLLHDVIEDGGVTREETRENFGEEVLRLVLFDTENKELSWEERKKATLRALGDCDRECAMLVCADKLSNIRDIREGLEKDGESFWAEFKCGRARQESLYREYVEKLSALADLSMYRELKETVETVFNKKGVSEQ